MSTKIYEGAGVHELTLTQYWGGNERGVCLQLTGTNCSRKIGYVGMTREEADAIAGEIKAWLGDLDGKTRG